MSWKCTCFKDPGVVSHLSASERSSIKRTGNHLLGLVSMQVLDGTGVICVGGIQIEKSGKGGLETRQLF